MTPQTPDRRLLRAAARAAAFSAASRAARLRRAVRRAGCVSVDARGGGGGRRESLRRIAARRRSASSAAAAAAATSVATVSVPHRRTQMESPLHRQAVSVQAAGSSIPSTEDGAEGIRSARQCINQICRGASADHDLHVIDATPARWHGGVVLWPRDVASTAAFSSRKCTRLTGCFMHRCQTILRPRASTPSPANSAPSRR